MAEQPVRITEQVFGCIGDPEPPEPPKAPPPTPVAEKDESPTAQASDATIESTGADPPPED